MFVIKTYKYKGFDVEELEGGIYRLGMFKYKTLGDLTKEIDRHISAKIKQLRQEQETILSGRCTNKAWHCNALKRVKSLQDSISELEAKL